MDQSDTKSPLEMLAATCNSIGQSEGLKNKTSMHIQPASDLVGDALDDTVERMVRSFRKSKTGPRVSTLRSVVDSVGTNCSAATTSFADIVPMKPSKRQRNSDGGLRSQSPYSHSQSQNAETDILEVSEQVLPPTLPLANRTTHLAASRSSSDPLAHVNVDVVTPHSIGVASPCDVSPNSPTCPDPLCQYCQHVALSYLGGLPIMPGIGFPCPIGYPQQLSTFAQMQSLLHQAAPSYHRFPSVSLPAASAPPQLEPHSYFPCPLPGTFGNRLVAQDITSQTVQDSRIDSGASVAPLSASMTTMGRDKCDGPSSSSKSRRHRCDWISGDGRSCGYSFETAKDLLDHVFLAHTNNTKHDAGSGLDLTTSKKSFMSNNTTPASIHALENCSFRSSYLSYLSSLASSTRCHPYTISRGLYGRTLGHNLASNSWPMPPYGIPGVTNLALAALYGQTDLVKK